MQSSSHRRDFLAASLLAAGYSATSAGFPVNETIRVGCIGTGGRCRRLMESLRKIEGVKIVALCDTWEESLKQARPLAEENAFVTRKHRELLDRSDIDAVLIGAPDHWHVPMTVDACEAGKDVYVEKPLTHDLSEGERVVQAQDKNKRIVQVGMQQRSMPHIQKGYEIVRSGMLGEIHKVHITWNRNAPRHKIVPLNVDPNSLDWKDFLGNAPEQPFNEYRFRNWRWFWDFGGGILTDLMVHFMDVANWYLDLKKPGTAVTIGDHYQTEGIWETPDTIQTLIDYPDKKVQVYFEGTFVNARNAAMLEVMGSEGTLYVDRGRYEVHPERKSKLPYSELILGQGPRGADFYDQPDGETLHLINWIESIRSRKKPHCPAEEGVRAAWPAHLGNIAFREKMVARWDQLGKS